MINTIYHLMMTVVVIGFTWIWTRIGVLLVMKSSRANEYEADEFSFRLGYGNELCANSWFVNVCFEVCPTTLGPQGDLPDPPSARRD